MQQIWWKLELKLDSQSFALSFLSHTFFLKKSRSIPWFFSFFSRPIHAKSSIPSPNLQFLLAHNIFPINYNLIEIKKLAHREPDSCYQFLLWPLSLLPTSQSKICELEEEDIMENENSSDNSHNSHGDEFNRSIPTNIQWMP
ncbi:hypothetical protein Droror1_Dr00016226 [Drosera rotundifolia]